MTYEELINKFKEGEEYANSIMPNNIFNRKELHSFQRKMLKWFDDNIGQNAVLEIIDQYPIRKRELQKRVMAITAEGKTLEHSML